MYNRLKNSSIFASAGILALQMILVSGLDAEGDANQGKRVFQRCKACHALRPGQHRVGPSLHGVFGREAGSADGFDGYSRGMRDLNITWTEGNLLEFIQAPALMVQRTRCKAGMVNNEQDRINLVEYLKQASD